MISVENVSKQFSDKQILHNVSFEVNKGEILGFLGPNAAGKTTTMRIITCYLLPNEGSVTVAGYDVIEQSLDVRRNIGYMPENPPIYPEMTVQSYLEFVARIKGVPGREVKKSIEQAMERVNITHVRQRICGKLSKGYRQRVGLAQALVHNPPILILDEPTSGLDPKQIIEFRELIQALAGDHTIILSTHILPEVKLVCDRIVIINEGRIVAQGTEEDLTQNIKGKEKLQIEVAGPVDDVDQALRNVKGVMSVEVVQKEHNGRNSFVVESDVQQDVRKDLARIVVDNKWDLYELRSLSMTLEEIFMQYTSGNAFANIEEKK